MNMRQRGIIKAISTLGGSASIEQIMEIMKFDDKKSLEILESLKKKGHVTCINEKKITKWRLVFQIPKRRKYHKRAT